MKVLRIVVSILFIVTSALFVFFYATEKMNTDTSVPVITIDEEILKVSINAKNKDLLKGVTAFDEKDGDLTDKIIVESVSAFIEPGYCRVTYAVCDSDNNVCSATRKLRYTDYTSPKFNMSDDLCFSLYERMNIADIITATDCIQGDISSEIVITSEDYTSSIAGVFNIEATVTNEKGDTATIMLPLIIEDENISAPKIELTDYIIYTKVNKELDFEEYIVGATDSRNNDLTDDVTYETDIDISKPGIYSVHYYAIDRNDARGHSVLTVIVED